MGALAVLLFAYVLSQFFRAFLAIVAADLTRELGLDAAQLGQLSAIWFAAFALAQFPVGVTLDRFGPRWTIAGFMLLAVAGSGLFAVAGGFAGLLAAMALIGAGCAPVLMGSLYYYGRVAPPEKFAMMASITIGVGTFGNLLGATPLALAVARFGWRPSIAAIAAVTLLSVVLVMAVLRDPPPVRSEGRSHGVLSGFIEVARLRPLWLMLPLTLVSYAVVIALRSLWIAPYFGQVHGFDTVARGNAALAMGAALSLGALAYGPFERWIGGPKRATLAGSVATAAALLALGLNRGFGPTEAVTLYVVIGAAGMTYGILMAHARVFFPPHLLGRGVTAMNFVFIGGAGLLQWISGQFVQAQANSGAAPAETYGQLHLVFGLALAAATVVYVFAPARPRVTTS
ncbi:MFS transporter [Alsobacter soli]|uniref:MFS transporter n=1 Tax=Alsobacter soli TaxID=2109933 RepID=A0A2T1HQX7_9HYPH|nr:MFS transporter [Alsobacter soli]PSC04053.1 MFS transporter [Alsobacter soli]